MKPYSIIIQYSTIADLKREAARVLGDDLDRLQRDLDKALDDAAALRESLAEAQRKLAEPRSETERPRGEAPPVPGPTALDGVVGMLVRFDFETTADRLARGHITPTQAADIVRRKSDSGDVGARVCIAALEALAAREVPASVASLGDRERLGRVVHEVWLKHHRPNGGGESWDDQDERAREVDRRIGEQLFSMGLTAGRAEAKEEREALRKRVEELSAALTCREEDVDRVSLERDAYQMSTEEGFEVAARLRAEAQHAREQGASEMRERAAQMVCNEGRAGCLRAVPHLAQQVVDAILSLPIDCAKMEEKR